jgi:hypothetical protein
MGVGTYHDVHKREYRDAKRYMKIVLNTETVTKPEKNLS